MRKAKNHKPAQTLFVGQAKQPLQEIVLANDSKALPNVIELKPKGTDVQLAVPKLSSDFVKKSTLLKLAKQQAEALREGRSMHELLNIYIVLKAYGSDFVGAIQKQFTEEVADYCHKNKVTEALGAKIALKGGGALYDFSSVPEYQKEVGRLKILAEKKEALQRKEQEEIEQVMKTVNDKLARIRAKYADQLELAEFSYKKAEKQIAELEKLLIDSNQVKVVGYEPKSIAITLAK
jgi:hypothetical protein